MTTLQIIKNALFVDRFNPFDLNQLKPPKTLRSGRFSVDLDDSFDLYDGFSESMEQLAADLNTAIENHGKPE